MVATFVGDGGYGDGCARFDNCQRWDSCHYAYAGHAPGNGAMGGDGLLGFDVCDVAHGGVDRSKMGLQEDISHWFSGFYSRLFALYFRLFHRMVGCRSCD